MRLSAKTEYATIAVLELATTYGTGERIQIRKIADMHKIPQGFLVQILLQLKGAGIVSSTRGAAGGYQLARDPAQISLWDVMKSIEGQDGTVISNLESPSPTSRVLSETWRAAHDAEKKILQDTSFGDLVDRLRDQPDMYYI